MTQREFIISALKDIACLFEEVQCRYRYDIACEANYVQILPSKSFKENKLLKNYRGQILDKFYSMFPTDSLIFLTEGSSIKFENEEYKIAGKRYNEIQIKWLKFKPFEVDDVLGVSELEIYPEVDYAEAA